MKRWIHASSDVDTWVVNDDPDTLEITYTKNLGSVSANIVGYDDDGYWGYQAYIFVNDKQVDTKGFSFEGSLDKAKSWADSKIAQYSKVTADTDWYTQLHEDLKDVDTSDWSEMQTERTEEDIRRAGGYNKYIKKEKDKSVSSNRVCSSYDLDLPNKIIVGMQWNIDGHCYEVIERTSNGKCKIEETWIAEDTGRECSDVASYYVANDKGSGVEYAYQPIYKNWKLYASGADWAPSYSVEDDYADYPEEDWDEYTPSASRGDYGPSNPWNAPGMSIRDFI